MVVLHNCMDLQEHQPGLFSETCHTSFGDCNQVTDIRVEEFISIKEEAGPEPLSFPNINTEHEVSSTSVCPLLLLRTAKCLSYLCLSVYIVHKMPAPGEWILEDYFQNL